ncbi:MAG: acetyl-CoA carboxylase biotin carboxyl carrier protein subunit [Vicinamibacterales bacterium]
MKLQLEIADRLRTVDVQRQTDGYLVTVDGRRHLVRAARVNGTSWSLLVSDENGRGARSVEAGVVPQAGNGSIDVHIDGYRIPVHLRNGRSRRSAASGRSPAGGVQRLSAPMPGKVVRVLVKPGDEVKLRQVLVVVEAMKMENELRATRDGTISGVFVAAGQSVEAGTPLVALE